jgi:hypothetical protein
MRQKRTIQIKRLLRKMDPILLLAVRAKYGDKTQQFSFKQITKKVKGLYKDHDPEIRKCLLKRRTV